MKCKQASVLISQSLERKLNWREKLSIKFHVMICVACRMFKSHLEVMSRVLKKQVRDVEVNQSVKLSNEARGRIEQAIDKQDEAK